MSVKFLSKLKLIFIPCAENNYRPEFLSSRILIWCFVALIVLKVICLPFLLCFQKSVFFGAIVKTVLIDSLNQDRQSAGLSVLKENASLDKAALLKAQDILNNDYFSHQSPAGISPWYWFQKVGYNYKFAGENLAIGFLDSTEVYQAWLGSSSHRANILNPNYKEVGTAILTGDFKENKTVVVVQFFGTSKQAATELKVQTKEGSRMTETPSEKTSATATPRGTLSAEIDSIEKEVPPVLKQAWEKATFNFFFFLSANYYRILQFIIYGFLGLIILVLIINVVVRFDVQHWDLILKALGFITILILFALIDKGVIIKLIPHNFNIY